jgi:hypothetical protein
MIQRRADDHRTLNVADEVARAPASGTGRGRSVVIGGVQPQHRSYLWDRVRPSTAVGPYFHADVRTSAPPSATDVRARMSAVGRPEEVGADRAIPTMSAFQCCWTNGADLNLL